MRFRRDDPPKYNPALCRVYLKIPEIEDLSEPPICAGEAFDLLQEDKAVSLPDDSALAEEPSAGEVKAVESTVQIANNQDQKEDQQRGGIGEVL
jgi:hypothetical protein